MEMTPVDVKAEWLLCDLVINTDYSVGRKLYASKAVLFLSCNDLATKLANSWKNNQNRDEVKIPCTFVGTRIFLEILHSRLLPETLEIDMELFKVEELFATADYFDCDLIRHMCYEAFKQRASPQTAWRVLTFFNRGPAVKDTFMEILRSMSMEDIRLTLQIQDDNNYFSKDDVKILLGLMGEPHRDSDRNYHHEQPFYRLAELSERLFEVDFTKTWSASDVVLVTANAEGKRLFSNQLILSARSSYFRRIFDHRFAGKMKEIEVSCTYEVMWFILFCIHDAADNFYFISQHLRMKHDFRRELWMAVSKEKLDIPSLREAINDCSYSNTTIIHLDEACSLEMSDSTKMKLLRRESQESITNWVYRSCDEVNCAEKNKDPHSEMRLLCSASATKPLLSLPVLYQIINQLKRK